VAYRVRTVRDVGEFRTALAAIGHYFGWEPSEEEASGFMRILPLDRMHAAFDDGALVGGAGVFPFHLTVPGGDVPCAGVTVVGVLPTHRRRGLLTRMMRAQLADIAARGEPLAALWASEAGIYGRFGYGLATQNARIELDRYRVALAVPERREGTVRLVGHEEALELLPAIYERVRAETSGFHSRSGEWWAHHSLVDDEVYRRGSGPLFRALLELEGVPEAYALYRVTHEWSEGYPASRLIVREEVSASPVAIREIWRFLLGIDLIARVSNRTMAPDHPLFLLVAEPARLRFRLGDGLWVRLVDVRAALTGRAYAAEGSLVLDLEDGFCPWNAGRWKLEAGPDGVSLRRSRRSADLRLGVAALGSAFLGGFSFERLVRAGQVEELRGGTAARADALFRTARAPWSPESF
jgi:predicted acetyltransferase